MDEKLYTKALTYLSKRPRSEKEVRDNLWKPYLRKKIPEDQKKVIEDQIATIITLLKKQKFINDSDFAMWWIEQRTRFKPKGKRAIIFELRNKGISQTIIEDITSRYQEVAEKTEKELAMELVEKRMTRYQSMPHEEIYRKLGGFLARRGFDLDVIRACIDEVLRKRV